MNPKIIKANRYKKTTTKKVKQKKQNNFKNNKTKSLNIKSKKVKKRKNNDGKILKIALCVSIIVVIGIVSKKIVKLENIPIIKAFFNNDEKELVKDYEFKIGVLNIDTTDISKTKNITLNELVNISALKLLEYDTNYSINYIVANSVTTQDNKVFNISINDEYKINADVIKNQIYSILSMNESNIYYSKLKDISAVDIIEENTLRITLNNENPYFIYSLDFPIYETAYKLDSDTDFVLASSSQEVVNFSKNETSSTIRSISVTNYIDSNSILEDFKNKKLDMFVTSSDSIINLIGKYEYNIKKVRNGESIFILGNKDSKLFSRKEIRQSIVYSLNREELIKSISDSFTEIIDLPYIYSGVKYKYDTYAATNALLSNGWKKIGGVYSNDINGEKVDLVLNLLVNRNDSVKVKLAQNIKEMLENNGIKINIEELTEEDINLRIEQKSYDLVLANVSINNNPDIRYLESYININQSTDDAIKKVSETNNFELIDENIAYLQNVLSEEIACIGIAAYDNDIIYQKYITGFEDLKYFYMFNHFNNIGRLSQID